MRPGESSACDRLAHLCQRRARARAPGPGKRAARLVRRVLKARMRVLSLAFVAATTLAGAPAFAQSYPVWRPQDRLVQEVQPTPLDPGTLDLQRAERLATQANRLRERLPASERPSGWVRGGTR